MAIRRNPNFRFNYFFRSLPVEQLARRCEQLMKAAEKEVEQLERKAREDAGLPVEPENDEELAPIELPKFRDIQRRRRKEEKEKAVFERKQLQDTVDDLAAQIEAIQKRLKEISEGSTIARVSPDATDSRMIRESSSAPPDRKDDDAPETFHENKEEDEEVEEQQDGAPGPDGVFVKFPEYDGNDEPLEWKKPFTQFCLRNRKSVKQSLDPEDRKDKVCTFCIRLLALKKHSRPHNPFFQKKINSLLKEQWLGLSEQAKEVWREWAEWDKKRYARDLAVFEGRLPRRSSIEDNVHVPKKRKSSQQNEASIPKKRRQ